MIFKETDRDNIRYLTLNVSRISESTEKLRELRGSDHNEVLEKFDSITNSINALEDKIDVLTKATVGTSDILQDLGNVLRSIRDLSKADGEVNKKQFEAIIAGIELITNMLEPKKVVSSCDEVVDDIQVIRVAKARRRRFATVHNRYRTHR